MVPTVDNFFWFHFSYFWNSPDRLTPGHIPRIAATHDLYLSSYFWRHVQEPFTRKNSFNTIRNVCHPTSCSIAEINPSQGINTEVTWMLPRWGKTYEPSDVAEYPPINYLFLRKVVHIYPLIFLRFYKIANEIVWIIRKKMLSIFPERWVFIGRNTALSEGSSGVLR